MAYMVYQRYATAIRDGYGHRLASDDAIRAQLQEARHTRVWLESLAIDTALRASLVEPIAVVEDALSGLLLASDPPPRDDEAIDPP